jgi:hypothetical protein
MNFSLCHSAQDMRRAVHWHYQVNTHHLHMASPKLFVRDPDAPANCEQDGFVQVAV